MKKIFCILMILTTLSSCILANADSELYTCYPRIGSDSEKNIIELDFTLFDNMPNEKFLIALYIINDEGETKLDKAVFCTVSEIQDIISSNLTAEDAEKKYFSIEHEQTPDNIKVFAWKDGLIPVCEEKVLFESEEDFIAINEYICSQITSARDILYRLENGIDVTVQFRYDEEHYLYNIVNAISADALLKKDSKILTREFARREYYNQLEEAKLIYSSMSSTVKEHLRSAFLSIGREDFKSIDYIITYLGLKEYLF